MSTAIEKTDPKILERLAQMVQSSGESSTYDPQLATSFIKWAAQNTNLISPAMACPNLPLGFELAFTRVDINPEPRFKEVYKQSDGGLSLTKVGLEKIQKGAGIRLDPKLTRKLDNGEDPLFAVYEFVGYYRDFDGTMCPVKGTKELDLHDDSAEIAKIRSRQKSQTAGDNEINELRRFISGHAESKAKNRGIRSFGIKSSYTDEELRQPFTCIRLIRTGRCEDPATQLMLTKMIHEEYMLAEQSLFGGSHLIATGKEPAALPAASAERDDSPPLETAPKSPHVSSGAQPKQCTVDECFGKGAAHVRACGAPATETSVQTQSEAWTIDVGNKAGSKITDPQVTVEDLDALLEHYRFISSGGDLPTEAVSKMVLDRDRVKAEVERRKSSEPDGQVKY